MGSYKTKKLIYCLVALFLNSFLLCHLMTFCLLSHMNELLSLGCVYMCYCVKLRGGDLRFVMLGGRREEGGERERSRVFLPRGISL